MLRENKTKLRRRDVGKKKVESIFVPDEGELPNADGSLFNFRGHLPPFLLLLLLLELNAVGDNPSRKRFLLFIVSHHPRPRKERRREGRLAAYCSA